MICKTCGGNKGSCKCDKKAVTCKLCGKTFTCNADVYKCSALETGKCFCNKCVAPSTVSIEDTCNLQVL